MSEKPKTKQIKKTPSTTSTEPEISEKYRQVDSEIAEADRRWECRIRHLAHLFSKLSEDEQQQHRKAHEMQISFLPPLGDPEGIFLGWWGEQEQITFPESIYTEV